MKKIFLIFIIIFGLYLPCVVNAEEFKLEWQNNFGGNDLERFEYVFQTKDNGFVGIGGTKSTDIEGFPNKGDYDSLAIKFDKDGNIEWKSIYGGSSEDHYIRFLETSDNNYLITFYSKSTDIEGYENKGGFDSSVFKFDKDGNIIWKLNLGGNGNELLYDMIEDDEGNYIGILSSSSTNIVGIENKGRNDILVVKFDKNGNILKRVSFGGNNDDNPYLIHKTKDDNFIIRGSFSSSDFDGLELVGSNDVLLLKINSDLELLAKARWGGKKIDNADKLLVCNDGGFLVSGTYVYDESADDHQGLISGGMNIVVLKFDENLNLLWKDSYGGESLNAFRDIYLTDNNFIYSFGYLMNKSVINGLQGDHILAKYDKDGNRLWLKLYGGNDIDSLWWYVPIENDNFVSFGSTYSTDIEGIVNKGKNDSLLVKFDSEGNVISQVNYGGSDRDEFRTLFYVGNGEYVGFVHSSSKDIPGITNKGGQDIGIVKFSTVYEFNTNTPLNGSYTVSQSGNKGKISLSTDYGYEVDKIIVKDTSDNLINIIKLDNKTYEFDLYSDVNIDVTFKLKKYKVDVKTNDNGSIEKIDDIEEGKTIVLNVSPKIDFKLSGLTILTESGKKIEIKETDLINKEDGSVEINSEVFVMPAENIVIEARWVLINPKTGVSNTISLVFTFMLVLVSGLFVVRKYNKSYEL